MASHQDFYDPETILFQTPIRRPMAARCRSTALGPRIEATAAPHPPIPLSRSLRIDGRSLGVETIVIFHPFPDVAVHVTEAPWIALERTDRSEAPGTVI